MRRFHALDTLETWSLEEYLKRVLLYIPSFIVIDLASYFYMRLKLEVNVQYLAQKF